MNAFHVLTKATATRTLPPEVVTKEQTQPRPQGLLLDDFQDGGSSVEDPGTQQKSRDQFFHGEWKFIQNGGQDKE